MNGFKWRAAICCETGQTRRNNEDNFYFNGIFKTINNIDQDFMTETTFKGSGIFAVFDGMGGESYSAWASSFAARLLSDYSQNILTQEQKYILQYIYEANKRIYLEAGKRNVTIGTTLAMAIIIENHIKVYNLGDSRAYLLHRNELICLTKDHNTPAGTVSKWRSHQLSQFLGIPEDEFIIEPHYSEMELFPGDKILLCSDGLTDMLSENALKCVLLMDISPQKIVSKLVDTSISVGGKDNITALVLVS
ncbi:MAG: protein phosphatase 2C domain-containing protein [Firmicutes bacterium]|nr:protein phosphatase 2C domain-containing protein [Bacillota bacterium]